MIDGPLAAALDATAMLFWTLRVAAGVGAALVGWFGTGPIVRLLYRGAFHRPVPRWLLPWCRLGGAALFGLLVFYLLPLGGGAGLGFGPGAGGGPGLGPGDGTGTKGGEKTVGADKPAPAKTGKKDVETLEIEVIGGRRYKNDERFYLVKRQEPVVALEAVEDYLKKNKEQLDEYVIIVLTPGSVDAGHPAVLRLTTIIEKNDRKPQLKDVQ